MLTPEFLETQRNKHGSDAAIDRALTQKDPKYAKLRSMYTSKYGHTSTGTLLDFYAYGTSNPTERFMLKEDIQEKEKSTFGTRLGDLGKGLLKRQFIEAPSQAIRGLTGIDPRQPLQEDPTEQGFLKPEFHAQTPLETHVQVLGEAAGGVNDIIGFGVAEAARGAFNLLPEPAQDELSSLGFSFLESQIGERVIQAVQAGKEGWDAFRAENPVQAENIEGVVNIATLLGIKKLVKADDLGEAVLKKGAKKAVEKIDDIIDSGVEKGIRPTVVGKGSFPRAEAAKKSARLAIKSIARRKNELRLTNEAGEIVVGESPKSLTQLSEAIDQTKKSIFKEYKSLAREADIKIDLSEAAEKLDDVINSKSVKLARPEVIDHARRVQERLLRAGALSVDEADDVIRELNESLGTFFLGRGDKAKAEVEGSVAAFLRGKADEAVEQATGAGNFQALKREYGALRSIEKEVSQRAIVNSRRAPKGFFDLTDVFTGSEIVQGLAFGDVHSLVRGIAGKTIKGRLNFLNEPNNIIKSMFKNVDKAFEKADRFNIKT